MTCIKHQTQFRNEDFEIHCASEEEAIITKTTVTVITMIIMLVTVTLKSTITVPIMLTKVIMKISIITKTQLQH